MVQDNHLTEEQVAQCADAIIDGKYKSLDLNLRKHLILCDECAAEVLSVTDIVIDFKEEEGKRRLKIFKPWIIAIASAAAIGTFIFIIATVTGTGNSFFNESAVLIQKDSIKPKLDTVKKINQSEPLIVDNFSLRKKPIPSDNTPNKQSPTKKTNDVAGYGGGAAFTPDENLENLFSNYTQAYRGEDVSVKTPRIISVPGNDSLKWSNPAREELIIEFFDNKGKQIHSYSQLSEGIAIPKLDKGLFYWKLINRDYDLLFVGKIIIE